MSEISTNTDHKLLEDESHGLIDWLLHVQSTDPDRVLASGILDSEYVQITASELVAKSLKLASGLLSIGVSPGSTLGLWIPNRIEWLITQFACSSLGVSILGINTRYRSHEIAHLFKTVPLSAIVLPNNFLSIDFLGTLGDAINEVEDSSDSFIRPLLVFVGDVPGEAISISKESFSFGELLSNGALDPTQKYGKSLSNLFTTSGSTSAPKVAGHSQHSIVRHSFAGAKALEVVPGDCILAVLPLCGVFGFNSVFALLFGGGSAALVETFDAVQAAEQLIELSITHVVGGDEMIGAIFSEVDSTQKLPALRRGGIANFAGRSKEIVVMAKERWGTIISGVYGSSELFALSAIWPTSAQVDIRGLGGGIVVDAGIEVRIADIDTDELISEGDSGELQFRGYNVIDEYLNNPKSSLSAFSSDGWFKTGDLGYIDHGGFVYQCRAREALRLRGFLVEPGEIEEFILLDTSIDEVHVVGLDTESGTKAFAFVRTIQDLKIDEAKMMAYAKKHLASYKVPERIIQVNEFPTTTGTNGTKVRFEELREIAKSL